MSGLDTTTAGFDSVLKDVYQGPIREQLNQRTRILSDFTKSDVSQIQWEGRQAIVPLHKSRNVGVKATAENGLIPAAGNQGYAKLAIKMAFWIGHIQITAQVIKASQTSKGAFTQAMNSEQNGLVEDISRQRNRALFNAGTGTLAAVLTTATSATVSLKNPGGVAGTVNATRFLQPGMTIAEYTGATLNFVDTISSIDTTNQTITTASSHTWTAADLITLGAVSGATTEGSQSLEPVGLLGIVDQTTYLTTIHGLDRSSASNAFFLSQVLSNVGTLSNDVIYRGIHNVEEVSGEVIDRFYCHHSVLRELLKLHEADRRYMGQQLVKPDTGTEPGVLKTDLQFGNIGVRAEKDCPYGTLFAVNTPHLFWIPNVEGEWADEDGSVLLRASSADAYEGRFRVFENFFSDKGNSHIRFDGINATVSAAVYSA